MARAVAATARTRAVFQVCQAATGTSMGTSTALRTAPGSGGVPRPMDPTHGTVTWTTTASMSTAATSIFGTVFLFVAFGMPSERSEGVLNS